MMTPPVPGEMFTKAALGRLFSFNEEKIGLLCNCSFYVKNLQPVEKAQVISSFYSSHTQSERQ